ncbi:MAG: ribosome biogenesis GTPase Der [Chromatiaceae bacterium]|nr:ribosome biogenesis GTPase Der [Gammaproteobacteria bacterium]MCB1873580.1 ribosome biogenesis GTPase Der [Gammaproteobacteria bacterium]MCB1880132.1 ribosome biogenesis GTPase Der [Gammaproteobacteria bacterium]MCP5448223.1 ribosome biogenesis GTPase Der [Chromatiaceae bacterium]
MLPVIVLVGRPNVGKSTLFNRLTRSRDALVADQPGLTRDRQYGVGKLGSKPYVVVDTGGISSSAEGVEMLMERQVQAAIDEADHIIFLVDAQSGANSADQQIAQHLRRTGKAITLTVNKSENLDPEIVKAEFHTLGLGEPRPVSAAHGRGVSDLVNQVLAQLPEADAEGAGGEERGTLIAVVGRPNVGKSTLVNRLLGQERVVTYDQPGTTRDSIFISFRHAEKAYTLIDTAGVRRRARVDEMIEKISVIKTLQAIEQSNVVLLVLDAQQGISEQDATLSGHVLESGRALVVVVNKWDGLDNHQRERVKEDLARKLPFLDFASQRFISARHGSGVGNLYQAVDNAYANAQRKLPTPELTRVLEQAVQEHQPPKVHGRRIKLRYAHQGGRNPPIVVIHGNQAEAVPASYRRYLINRFRQAFSLHGTPIRMEFKSGDNPFEGRKNTLTQRQVRKRQRLKSFVNRQR